MTSITGLENPDAGHRGTDAVTSFKYADDVGEGSARLSDFTQDLI